MTEIPKTVINAIKSSIKNENMFIENITCDTIRKYLKRLKKTEYNNHVSLIKKNITNIEPSQLTDHETRIVCLYFGIVVQLFTTLRNNNDKNDPNCPYHPFFIYKIIEQILKDPYQKKRCNDILSCIHLQSRNTLIENDRLWFNICDHIPEFTKIPTHGRT